jgi:acyl carrier protein
MTRNDIAAVLIEELTRIAPEAEPARIDRDADLREELDIDSIDFLNLVTALVERLGLEIPERDYGRFATLGTAEAYLVEKLGAAT